MTHSGGHRNINFAGNSAIDAAVKDMLPCFDPASQRRIGKALLDAYAAAVKHNDENTDAGARHIFRELIPAAHLNTNGFALEYEKPIDGKTPDWLDERAGLVLECHTHERGGSAPFHDRVIAAVAAKAARYGSIVRARRYQFVAAVYIDFLTCISLEEVLEDADRFRVAFQDSHPLSAIVFYTETQVVNGRQEYGYVCLAEDAAGPFPNWPFHTQGLD